MFYFDNDDELDDLRRQARHERQYLNDLARHPNCQDPDHPGCEACEGDNDPDDSDDSGDSSDE